MSTKVQRAIELKKKGMSVARACKEAGVSVSAYYHARSKGKKPRGAQRPELVTFSVPQGSDHMVIVMGRTANVVQALNLINQAGA